MRRRPCPQSPALAAAASALAWRALHEELSAIVVDESSPEAIQHKALLAYVEARARQTDLLSRASTDASVTAAAVAEAEADANSALESLK